MALCRGAYRGCLLGMAVGDALGYAVDKRSWPEIREAYGPNGLMGYDLVNGIADVTSYTQLAAFTGNGLLLGLTRGQLLGKTAPLIRYVELACREWATSQRPWGRPAGSWCWLSRKSALCRRRCMDTRLLDTLSRERLGAPEAPINHSDGPQALTTAVGVGLFARRDRIRLRALDRLGADAVALTHGSPRAFLSGALVAHIIARLLHNPRLPLDQVALEACGYLNEEFGHQYSQVFELTDLMRRAIAYAQNSDLPPVEVLEQLGCDDCGSVLAGAVYACLASGGDFDRGVILAVNHSGRSAAVGALTGAILGLISGEEALPDFYLEGLEPVELLRELADDLYTGCPMERGSKLFDLDWDYKYLHGGQ